jgi:hypothetical protein
MTTDPAFKQMVLTQIGDPNFKYARYEIELSPISIADGVSRGDLTVAITDSSLSEAKRLRKAFVDVFTKAYLEPDGYLRTRFIETKRVVAEDAAKDYLDAYRQLAAHPAARDLPLDDLIRTPEDRNQSLHEEYNRQEAELRRELAEVAAALALGNPDGRTASIVLGQPVSDSEAQAALQLRHRVLLATIAEIARQRAQISDAAFPQEFLVLLDRVRGSARVKLDAETRLADAQAAVRSAQSVLELKTAEQGGVGSSIAGRIAITLGVTIVFGLIAIYVWEWLSQVRRGLRG